MSIVNNNNIYQKLNYSKEISYIKKISMYLINTNLPAYYNLQSKIKDTSTSEESKTTYLTGQCRYENNRSIIHLVNSYNFVHEYGHHLDHAIFKNKCLSDDLSFLDVINEFKVAIKICYNSNKIKISTLNFYNYLTKNTEVFARSYDFYVNVLKLKVSKDEYLKHNTEMENIFFVNPVLTQKIFEYFSQIEKVYNN